MEIKSSRWTTVFDLAQKESQLSGLEKESQMTGFWDNPTGAAKIMRQVDQIKKEIGEWEGIKRESKDLVDFIFDTKDDDSEQLGFVEDSYLELKKRFEKYEKQKLYSGKYDARDAIISIHAGAGGVDAQDWAEMLLRMYLRYCERMGFKSKIIDKTSGTEAGIKSVTFSVEGRWAYGNFRAEAGVHRLVRLSPFNADNLRQTSFALVEALPALEHDLEVELNPQDLRIDTFRSSGAGGQHVNTTDSAVRITHTPTGITASCQSERSQLQNKERAMAVLKAKVLMFEENEKLKEEKKIKGEHKSAEWGNQIRSYVLHPYQMVKDHRTGHETSDTQGVLDGDIEGFVEEFLKKNIK